ncbi:hypothetical protein HDV06_004428 [Boothiomyces sp. JEL0866]|nr:hypothetical protein HDV06_004428 [Boothiomyces sp. JEL0866]
MITALLVSIATAAIPTCGGPSQITCPKGLTCAIPGGNTIGLCLDPSQLATNTITDGPSPTISVNGTSINGTVSGNSTTTVSTNTTALPTTTTTTGPPPVYPTPQQPNSALVTGASLALLAIIVTL